MDADDATKEQIKKTLRKSKNITDKGKKNNSKTKKTTKRRKKQKKKR